MEKNTEFTQLTPTKSKNTVSIGQIDKAAGNETTTTTTPEGSMLMGPEHPFFESASSDLSALNSNVLAPGAVPTGARFDPITAGPSLPRQKIQKNHKQMQYHSGDPDRDDLLPPNNFFF